MDALYYPFHLCHEQTLKFLLTKFQTVHFRDFMALRLTPLMGTTAFPDRMGDYHPELLKAGRIVQGYDLSGSMDLETTSAVNRDLADAQWRYLFKESLLNDRRFQRGLFADPQDELPPTANTPPNPVCLQFQENKWTHTPFQVETVQALSRHQLHGEESAQFEYGWALIKTSASLIYTIQLCHQLKLVAATDSASHHQLLNRTCEQEQIDLKNSCIKREGY